MTYRDSKLPVGPPRQRALLSYLLIARNTMVTTGELVEAIWGGAEPATARTQIQMDVSRIRSTLRQHGAGQPLSGGQSGYRLEVEHGALDLDVFDEHLDRARALFNDESYEPGAATLRQGLALWRGPALADAKAAFVEGARFSLTERWLGAHELLADVQLRSGLHHELVPELTTLVSAHPLREPLVRRLVLALYRCARQPDALLVAREFRRRLVEEQGLEPSRDMAALELSVLRCDPALDLTAERRSITARPTPLAQLPADLPTFTGRSAELAELREAIATAGHGVPVVVIEGTAGVGKTALALRLAHSVADQFPDGQLYVDLLANAPRGPLRAGDALGTLLRAMGVRPEDVPQDVATAASVHRGLLAGRRILLVLDNAASVQQVQPLLPGDQGSAVIVTTRHSLPGLTVRAGAHAMMVRAMSPHYAYSLLARLLGPSYVARAASDVAELIHLCARLPLALCIAAARIRRDDPAGVARYVARLRQDRLGTLSVPDDDDAAVRSAFGLSYRAATPAMQRHFRLLALVAGQSVPVEAMSAMAGTSVAGARQEMGRLAAAHLVDEVTEDRFGFHDLLREYAREQVAQDAERDAAVGRLYSWYVESALGAAATIYPHMTMLPAGDTPRRTGLTFADARSAVAWLDVEFPNLLAAIHWGPAGGQLSGTWRLADALRGYLMRRGHLSEWLAIADSAMKAAIEDGNTSAQASVHLSLATAYRRSSDYARAITHLNRARDLAAGVWPEGEHVILANLGAACADVGSLARAHRILTQAIDLSRGYVGEVAAQAANNLGYVLRELGHTAQAIRLGHQAIEWYTQIGSPSAVADARETLGLSYHHQGRTDEALEQLNHAVRIYLELGDELSEAIIRAQLAIVLAECGRPLDAEEHAKRSMELAAATRSGRIRAESLGAAAIVYLGLGDPARAHRLADEAHAFACEVGVFRQQIVALIARAGAAQASGDERASAADARAARDLAAQLGFARLSEQADRMLVAIPAEQSPPKPRSPAQLSTPAQRSTPARRIRRSRTAKSPGPS